MVAGDEAGQVRFYGESPSSVGGGKPLLEMHTKQLNAANSTDPRLWPNIHSGEILPSGAKLTMKFTAEATDTFDSTDHFWQIPVVLFDKLTGAATSRMLSKDDMDAGDTNTKFQDITCTINIETQVGSFTVPDGVVLQLTGKMYVEFKDDTA